MMQILGMVSVACLQILLCSSLAHGSDPGGGWSVHTEEPTSEGVRLLSLVDPQGQVKWKRFLPNNDDIVPADAFIVGEGKYTVTFDDTGHRAVFAVVIYDERGKIVFIHNPFSLGLDFFDPAAGVRSGAQGIHWLDVTFRYVIDDDVVIRFQNGQTAWIALENGWLETPEDIPAPRREAERRRCLLEINRELDVADGSYT